ncbi:MAG: DUF2207 domain-containing protein [Candidatus Berkelbacteria bacterium]|nr:DUF2207 domain-containing protein [Candidatus Berkelbacteria bacterium]MCR4307273.1 DUF2207 domain-containing protein [Candidatus Berkelbacteria bacterium]
MRLIHALVGTAVLAGMLLIAPGARATVGVNSLKIDANLGLNGSVTVKEEIVLAGSSVLDWQVFSNLRGLVVSANGERVPNSQLRFAKKGTSTRLVSNSLASTKWELSYKTTGTLIRHNDRDQFFFKVFQEPGVTINEIQLTFSLPESSTQTETQTLSGNVYAIGGVIGASSELTGSRTITYNADYAGPKGLMTISASWPKSILQLNRVQEAKLALLNLDSLPWIILGVSLPMAALFVLLFLSIRQKRQDRVKLGPMVSQLPSELSPMIVGVLVNKKIYPEEIVALLVDLCYRGYLVIIKNGPDYFFGKRKPPDQHLQLWEKNILEQVLPKLETKISNADILKSHKQVLFSPMVHDAFNEIYEIITQHQYFVENPHLTRIRYKLIALCFYFASVVGLVWTAVSDITPYLLIPLIGTIILSWLILRLTANLTSYTATGLAQRSAWLSFSQFLSDPNPIDPAMARNQTFEKYLAYAIALDKTAQWTYRFEQSSSTIVKPDWLVAYQELDAGALGGELVEFVSKTSKLLTTLRGPLVN